MISDTVIHHMCREEEWAAARLSGSYPGSSQDAADGFIHFSTASQIVESAAKHRAGQTGLVLLSVDAARLGGALKWEPSRGGELFPHLYGPLAVDAVTAVDPLPLGPDGRHIFPPIIPRPSRLIDLYPIAGPLLRRLDPETAHGITVAALKSGLAPRSRMRDDPILRIEASGGWTSPIRSGWRPGSTRMPRWPTPCWRWASASSRSAA